MKDKYRQLKPEAFEYQRMQEQLDTDLVIGSITTILFAVGVLGLVLMGILMICAG